MRRCMIRKLDVSVLSCSLCFGGSGAGSALASSHADIFDYMALRNDHKGRRIAVRAIHAGRIQSRPAVIYSRAVNSAHPAQKSMGWPAVFFSLGGLLYRHLDR
jgi:hypothetical protein